MFNTLVVPFSLLLLLLLPSPVPTRTHQASPPSIPTKPPSPSPAPAASTAATTITTTTRRAAILLRLLAVAASCGACAVDLAGVAVPTDAANNVKDRLVTPSSLSSSLTKTRRCRYRYRFSSSSSSLTSSAAWLAAPSSLFRRPGGPFRGPAAHTYRRAAFLLPRKAPTTTKKFRPVTVRRMVVNCRSGDGDHDGSADPEHADDDAMERTTVAGAVLLRRRRQQQQQQQQQQPEGRQGTGRHGDDEPPPPALIVSPRQQKSKTKTKEKKDGEERRRANHPDASNGCSGTSSRSSSSSSSSSRTGIGENDTCVPLQGASLVRDGGDNSSNIHNNKEGGNSKGRPTLPSAEEDRVLLQSWVRHDGLEYHRFTDDEATHIRNDLLCWYQTNRRMLPWRGDPPPWNSQLVMLTEEADGDHDVAAVAPARKRREQPTKKQANDDVKDFIVQKTYPLTPYGVWVSEVMLQQTRVDTVIRYWVNFMDAFPTVRDLADATAEEVNKMWAGLGYYRRARLMHDAAKVIVKEHHGHLPTTSRELQLLPGIGRYTANAIASISFDECVPVVDGNVCRVLSRLRGIAQSIKAPPLKDRHGWDLAKQIVSAGGGSHPGHVNQALMEVGATYCSPSGTGIHPDDPLKLHYWSTRLGRAVWESSVGRHSGNPDGVPCGPSAPPTGSKCPICAEGGVQQVLDAILEAVSTAASSESSKQDDQDIAAIQAASTAGHRAFPLPPEPKLKREEVWAVAALEMPASVTAGVEDEDDDGGPDRGRRRWLMVQRPPTGLLASQWEFPSALLWSSADQAAKNVQIAKSPKKNQKKQGKDDPNKANATSAAAIPKVSSVARAQALDRLLQELSVTERGAADSPPFDRILRLRVGDGEPIEHVFSHIRHTLWIEHGTLDGLDGDHTARPPPLEWRDASGRRARWMSSDEMASVGVTACVLKILKLVESEVPDLSSSSSGVTASSALSGKSRSGSSSSSHGSATARAKRPAQAKNGRQQPSTRRKKT